MCHHLTRYYPTNLAIVVIDAQVIRKIPSTSTSTKTHRATTVRRLTSKANSNLSTTKRRHKTRYIKPHQDSLCFSFPKFNQKQHPSTIPSIFTVLTGHPETNHHNMPNTTPPESKTQLQKATPHDAPPEPQNPTPQTTKQPPLNSSTTSQLPHPSTTNPPTTVSTTAATKATSSPPSSPRNPQTPPSAPAAVSSRIELQQEDRHGDVESGHRDGRVDPQARIEGWLKGVEAQCRGGALERERERKR